LGGYGYCGTAGHSARFRHQGTVHFTDTPAGLAVSAQISNATPGLHGFHIHEFGGCAELGKAAGGHFNPEAAPHGMLMKDGPHKAHAGDMGNITVDAAAMRR